MSVLMTDDTEPMSVLIATDADLISDVKHADTEWRAAKWKADTESMSALMTNDVDLIAADASLPPAPTAADTAFM